MIFYLWSKEYGVLCYYLEFILPEDGCKQDKTFKNHVIFFYPSIDNVLISICIVSLYGTPWFLTLFAASFPIGFVSRVLDLVFLEGKPAVIKVSPSLILSLFKVEFFLPLTFYLNADKIWIKSCIQILYLWS